ncbi:hypothetical protein ACJX0J_036913, partial [Zea mays]
RIELIFKFIKGRGIKLSKLMNLDVFFFFMKLAYLSKSLFFYNNLEMKSRTSSDHKVTIAVIQNYSVELFRIRWVDRKRKNTAQLPVQLDRELTTAAIAQNHHATLHVEALHNNLV